MAEILISTKLKEKHYTADALIVWCSDDRFYALLETFLIRYDIRRPDRLFLAGGANCILDKDKFVLEQIKTLTKLHSAKRIILMTHSDCDACGGLRRWSGNRDKEFLFHKKTLEEAAEKVRAALKRTKPNIKIETVFADFENLVKI